MSAARTAALVVGAALGLFLLAGAGLGVLVAVGDDSRSWLRDEAYSAAVDAALFDHLARRGDPALVARDLTAVRLGGRDMTYAPCPIAPAALAASPHLCVSTPSGGRLPARALCRGAPCVTVRLTPQAWADAGERAAVLAVLSDPRALCAAAERVAVNGRAAAAAVGCGRRRLDRVHVVVQLIRRNEAPCGIISNAPAGAPPPCPHAVAAEFALS